jgi:hypothetical protein
MFYAKSEFVVSKKKENKNKNKMRKAIFFCVIEVK